MGNTDVVKSESKVVVTGHVSQEPFFDELMREREDKPLPSFDDIHEGDLPLRDDFVASMKASTELPSMEDLLALPSDVDSLAYLQARTGIDYESFFQPSEETTSA